LGNGKYAFILDRDAVVNKWITFRFICKRDVPVTCQVAISEELQELKIQKAAGNI
jgi:hypothetical protein